MLSPSETAFVEHLVETGDANAAAVAAGVQPNVARDPRVQAAIVEHIRNCGALDAAYARRTLYELAKDADLDSVRLRAATTLWERGLGKIPDQIEVSINDHSLTREALYAEIRLLIDEIGLPPLIEGEATTDAGVAQMVEYSEPEAAASQQAGREVAGSSPVTGTTYAPPLPTKWR